MAIPDVPLNIDRRGYAGSLLTPYQQLSSPGPLRVPRFGRSRSGLGSYLKKQARNRDAIAKVQLKLLKQGLRKGGARTRTRRRETRGARPLFGGVVPKGGRQVNERARAGMMAQALMRGPGQAHGMRGAFDTQNLADIIGSIGIPAAHRGMMQTGQLLASQGRGGVYDPETPEEGNRYGFFQGADPHNLREARGGTYRDTRFPSRASRMGMDQERMLRGLTRGPTPTFKLQGGTLPRQQQKRPIFGGGRPAPQQALPQAARPAAPQVLPQTGQRQLPANQAGGGGMAAPSQELLASKLGQYRGPSVQPGVVPTGGMAAQGGLMQGGMPAPPVLPTSQGGAQQRLMQTGNQGGMLPDQQQLMQQLGQYRGPAVQPGMMPPQQRNPNQFPQMFERGTLPGRGKNTRTHPFFMNAPSNFRGGSLPGTLPNNQTANLHKGEAVISADQTDEPLMRYLMGDKLRKLATGQMDGKGTGPGDMPSYRHGSNIPGAPVADEDAFEDLLRGEIGGEDLQAEDIPWNERVTNILYGEEPLTTEVGTAGRLGEIGGRMLGAPGRLMEDLPGAVPFGPEIASGFAAATPQAEIPQTADPATAPEDSEPEPPPELSLSEQMLAAAEESAQPASQVFDINSKEYHDVQTADRDARNLRWRAENIQGWLMKNALGGSLSPEMYKTMSDQIKQFDQLADAADKRKEKASKVARDEKQAGDSRVQDAYATGIQAETGNEQAIQRRLRDMAKIDAKFNVLEAQWEEADDEKREQLLAKMAEEYRAKAGLAGREISQEDAELTVMSIMAQRG